MLSAEKKAKRFEEEVREACDYGDFWFTVELVGLRHEFHEIHEVKGQLIKAYNDLENVCLNNREEVYEPVTNFLLSYVNSRTTIIQAIDACIQKLKSQIHTRRLLEHPKFRSYDVN